jgi:hypothetical protein
LSSEWVITTREIPTPTQIEQIKILDEQELFSSRLAADGTLSIYVCFDGDETALVGRIADILFGDFYCERHGDFRWL